MGKKWNFNNEKRGSSSDYVAGSHGVYYKVDNFGSGRGSGMSQNWNYSNCHSGNTPIFTIGEGTLFAGGWSRGAKPEAGWYVIDLAGRYDQTACTGAGFERTVNAANRDPFNVLNLFIQDFGVPTYGRAFWDALADDVKDLLTAGNNILVACTGGHGRTGLVVSILAYLLCQVVGDDPIAYIRKIYCPGAVETLGQERYVYDMCRLDLKPSLASASAFESTNYKTWQCCAICGIFLDKRLGDDLEAGVCSSCIYQYQLSANDLMKMALDNGHSVEELGDICEYCGEYISDANTSGICEKCQTFLDDWDESK